jgi:hypothetical protein
MALRLMRMDVKKLFRVFLYLVSIHSFCIGVGLIIIPLEHFGFFGLEGYEGIFFKIQGGVFHIVMCGVYIPAAMDPVQSRILVGVAIFAKFTATVFLLSYSIFVEMAWMVVVSGIMDFLIGVILVWFNSRLVSEES